MQRANRSWTRPGLTTAEMPTCQGKTATKREVHHHHQSTCIGSKVKMMRQSRRLSCIFSFQVRQWLQWITTILFSHCSIWCEHVHAENRGVGLGDQPFSNGMARWRRRKHDVDVNYVVYVVVQLFENRPVMGVRRLHAPGYFDQRLPETAKCCDRCSSEAGLSARGILTWMATERLASAPASNQELTQLVFKAFK